MSVTFGQLKITGAILAGGQARRMGGRDKGLVELAGRALVEHVIDRLRPQVHAMLINANRNRDAYERYGLPIVGDELEGFHGPLAGMASCLRHADSGLLVTAPCDAPLLPQDLVARLVRGLQTEAAELAVAHNGDRLQPVFCLLHTDLFSSIEQFLNAGERKIDKWFALHKAAVVDFSDKPEAFVNVNTPEEIAVIEPALNTPAD